MDLSENRTFFFDLDRTIWNWNEIRPNALDLLETLESTDRNVYFHTDNTLLSRKGYADKLTNLGYDAGKEQVLTSGYIAGKLLNSKGATKAYIAGESSLISEIQELGVNMESEADHAVLGFDRNFSYDKLEKLRKISAQNGKILVCSTEKTFNTKNSTQLHQKPLNSAVNEFAETQVIGKPSQVFVKHFKKYFDYFPGKSVFIGDRPVDIEAGNQLGMSTAALMQGYMDESRLRDLEGKRVPDYALTSLDKLRRRII